jgi:hypothetical protein
MEGEETDEAPRGLAWRMTPNAGYGNLVAAHKAQASPTCSSSSRHGVCTHDYGEAAISFGRAAGAFCLQRGDSLLHRGHM